MFVFYLRSVNRKNVRNTRKTKVSRVPPSIALVAGGCLRAMVAGYTELWADADALTKNDLDIGQATLEVTPAKIKEFKVSIASALEAGSMAARRDWAKVCTLERELLKESGGKLWTSDDELEVAAVALSMAAYEKYRVRSDLDIWVIPGFAQDVLGCDPVALQRSLEANYPTVGKDQDIQPNTAQWVDGKNKVLHTRASEDLKRTKMWFQKGDPREVGYTKYYYTGWKWDVLPATSDVAACPELAPLADRYDEWAASVGYPNANHYIVTRYEDGAHSIGYHFDKDQSIEPNSLITVVKTGEFGRRFQLRHRVVPERAPGETNKDYNKRSEKVQAQEKAFFDEVLAPGTAVIMTLEANLLTQHGVPKVPECGPSGSWVARTIFENVPCGQAKRTKWTKRKDGLPEEGDGTERPAKSRRTHAPGTEIP